MDADKKRKTENMERKIGDAIVWVMMNENNSFDCYTIPRTYFDGARLPTLEEFHRLLDPKSNPYPDNSDEDTDSDDPPPHYDAGADDDDDEGESDCTPWVKDCKISNYRSAHDKLRAAVRELDGVTHKRASFFTAMCNCAIVTSNWNTD